MHIVYTHAIQGAPESGWILLDYGDIIVHIMTPKSRSYYDLESFWANGVEVPLDGVLKPNAPEQQEVAAAVEEVVSRRPPHGTRSEWGRVEWPRLALCRCAGSIWKTANLVRVPSFTVEGGWLFARGYCRAGDC